MLTIAAVLLGSVSSALAEAATYDHLIANAVQEFSLAHYIEARSLFERAHAIQPSARTLRGMGMAAFEQRAYVAAIQRLRQALSDRRKPLTEEQRTQVKTVLTRAEGYIALYELEVTPSEAQVTIDSKPAVIEDGVLLLDPGAHEVVVILGDEVERRRLVVQPNEKSVLRIRLASSVASRSAPQTVTRSLSSTGPSTESAFDVRAKWAVAAGALATVGLTASLGLTLRARRLRDDAGCSGGECPSRAAREDLDRAVTSASAATATLIVGATAAAIGVGLSLWPRKERHEAGEARPDANTMSRLRLVPAVSHNFAGVSVGGNF